MAPVSMGNVVVEVPQRVYISAVGALYPGIKISSVHLIIPFEAIFGQFVFLFYARY